MKLSSIQYDDAIVEVTWSAERDTWVILRVRDDKLQGNHFKTVQSILKSIADGVEAPQVSLFLPAFSPLPLPLPLSFPPFLFPSQLLVNFLYRS